MVSMFTMELLKITVKKLGIFIIYMSNSEISFRENVDCKICLHTNISSLYLLPVAQGNKHKLLDNPTFSLQKCLDWVSEWIAFKQEYISEVLFPQHSILSMIGKLQWCYKKKKE